MPEETPIYDLMLLLSTSVEEERRAKVLADVETAISGSSGTIVHDGDWGPRALAYRIDHQDSAEYHLLQFTGPPALIDSLKQRLAITDGVLRFRIIKVLPGTPPPPRPEPAAVPARAAAAPAATAPTPEAAATPDAAPATPDAAPATPDAPAPPDPAAETEPEASQ